jgi:hypothetical protein
VGIENTMLPTPAIVAWNVQFAGKTLCEISMPLGKTVPKEGEAEKFSMIPLPAPLAASRVQVEVFVVVNESALSGGVQLMLMAALFADTENGMDAGVEYGGNPIGASNIKLPAPGAFDAKVNVCTLVVLNKRLGGQRLPTFGEVL